MEKEKESKIKNMFNNLNNNPQTVAILGGSFDPPTIAHIQVASEIYNTHEDIDAVWIIPCGDGRGDKSLKTAAVHRIKMLNLILKDIIGDKAPIESCDIEIRENKYYPTFELIEALEKQNPGIKFIFCMGSDLLEGLRTWDFGDKLAEEQEFIIMLRNGYNPDKKYYPKKYRMVETIIDGSSTKVRNRIKEQIEVRNKINLAINGLTTVSVIDYIIANKLYQV